MVELDCEEFREEGHGNRVMYVTNLEDFGFGFVLHDYDKHESKNVIRITAEDSERLVELISANKGPVGGGTDEA